MVNPTENLINARLLSNMKTSRISTFLVQNVFVKSLRRAYRKKIIFQLILELKFVSVHVGKTNASFSMTIKKWVCFGTHNDRSVIQAEQGHKFPFHWWKVTHLERSKEYHSKIVKLLRAGIVLHVLLKWMVDFYRNFKVAL